MPSPLITGGDLLITVALFALIGWVLLKAYNDYAERVWAERLGRDDDE